jgi:hypothetical protein
MYLGHRPEDDQLNYAWNFFEWPRDGVSARGCSVEPQDFVLAHMWLNIGSGRYRDEPTYAEKDAVVREARKTDLVWKDLAKAEQFARKWDAAYPREP